MGWGILLFICSTGLGNITGLGSGGRLASLVGGKWMACLVGTVGLLRERWGHSMCRGLGFFFWVIVRSNVEVTHKTTEAPETVRNSLQKQSKSRSEPQVQS